MGISTRLRADVGTERLDGLRVEFNENALASDAPGCC
jgi:hypothetical protein